MYTLLLPWEMSDKELAEYRKYFWAQDTSGDGRLNRGEFKQMMLSMGVSLNDHEINVAFSAADKDGSGTISFHEFAQTYLKKPGNASGSAKPKYSTKRLEEVFRLVDRDKDGSLTHNECFQAMKMLGKHMSQSGITRIMQLMDKNHDGGVSFAEFCRFMEL